MIAEIALVYDMQCGMKKSRAIRAIGHAGMQHEAHSGNGGVPKRLIFLKIENVKGERYNDVFSINARRIPQFMVDMDIHNMQLFDLKELPGDTGWGSVPKPVF